MNWQGSPGAPLGFDYASNETALLNDYHYIIIRTLDILRLWRDTPHSDVLSMNSLELLEKGLTEIVRIFIKKEPHSASKILEGRWRLIMSVSLCYSLAQAVVYRSTIDLDVLNNRDIPAKPGWSATDEGLEDVHHWVRTKIRNPLSNDQGSWDWLVPFVLQMLEAQTLVVSNDMNEGWANMVYNETTCTASRVMMTSDGEFYTTLLRGLVTSGGLRTAQANSRNRAILAKLANTFIDPNQSECLSATMGDDCVENAASSDPQVMIQAYKQFGFNLKDLHYGQDFEFCSHKWVESRVAIPLGWRKSLYHLLENEFDDEVYATFLHEMRHLRRRHGSEIDLDDVVQFLRWVGYLDSQDFDPANQGVCLSEIQNNTAFQMVGTKKPTKVVQVRVPTAHDVAQGEVLRQERLMRLQDKANAQAVKSARIGPSVKQQKAKSKTSKANTRTAVKPVKDYMSSSMSAYAKCVSNPFNSGPARGPAKGNVVPTERSFILTTTSSFGAPIAADTVNMIGLFGGAGNALDDSIDSVSTHSYPQYIGGTADTNKYIIGPLVGTTIAKQAVGYLTDSLSLGDSSLVTNTSASTPIQNSVSVGLVALEGFGSHTRWRCVGMGVRLWNVTAEASREGYVQWCQPGSDFQGSTIQEYRKFSPNFSTSTMANSDAGLEIVWLPRPQSLAYNHAEGIVAVGNTLGTDLNIWISNEGSNAQIYQVEVIYHWEIAGASVATFTSESASDVHGDTVIGHAIRHVRASANNGMHLGNAIKHFAGKAVGAVSAAAKDPTYHEIARVAMRSVAALTAGI